MRPFAKLFDTAARGQIAFISTSDDEGNPALVVYCVNPLGDAEYPASISITMQDSEMAMTALREIDEAQAIALVDALYQSLELDGCVHT